MRKKRAEEKDCWKAEENSYWKAEEKDYWKTEENSYWKAEVKGYWKADKMCSFKPWPLMKKGLLSIKDAAKEAGLTVGEFQSKTVGMILSK